MHLFGLNSYDGKLERKEDQHPIGLGSLALYRLSYTLCL